MWFPAHAHKDNGVISPRWCFTSVILTTWSNVRESGRTVAAVVVALVVAKIPFLPYITFTCRGNACVTVGGLRWVENVVIYVKTWRDSSLGIGGTVNSL